LLLLKEKLALARLTCPLFDTARTTRALERAYEQMWRRWQRGDAPAGFKIRDDA
jgi:predicted O-linked N-acetylglucosamine transferase (SPINDLY family)